MIYYLIDHSILQRPAFLLIREITRENDNKKGENDEGRMAKISGDNAVLIISHIGQGF